MFKKCKNASRIEDKFCISEPNERLFCPIFKDLFFNTYILIFSSVASFDKNASICTVIGYIFSNIVLTPFNDIIY